MFSISIRSRKKKLRSCPISFLVQPYRSPGIMLLCLSASRIYNKSFVQHFDPQPKKKIRQLFYTLSGSCWQKSWHDVIMPERFQHIKHVQLCDLQPKKKKLDCCSMSFPVRPGRSPGMMLLCLSASKIYNTFSISTRSRKRIRQLFYILSGSPRQKSWHDVIMPERFQDI